MSMTESECIESLNGIYPEWCSEKEEYEMAQVAITALEEIQQYRAIGTVSEFQQLKEKATAIKSLLDCHNDFDLSTSQKNYELVKAVRVILGLDSRA